MTRDPWVLIAGGFHNNGGMDKANLALAEYLTGEGTPVHLVTHSADESISTNALAKIHLISRPLHSFTLGKPLLDLRGRLIARSVTSQYPQARVVVNGSNCEWPGINWAHYIHHAWNPKHDGQSSFEKVTKATFYRVDKIRERSAFKRAHMVLANSDVTRKHILKYFSVSPNRVKTLYLGSDPTWSLVTPQERGAARTAFRLSKSGYSAVFVGALGTDKRKGIDTLLAAWKLLCSDIHWDVDLLVAGDGRALPLWRSTVDSWGLTQRIRLLGFRSDIRELLAASDLLVSPTRYEPYGLNVQEAICRGIPAIASASSGIAERYPENLKTFLLPKGDNVADLIERLSIWRSNVDVWKFQFQPLGMTLRSHTWHDMARNFVSLVNHSQMPSSSN